MRFLHACAVTVLLASLALPVQAAETTVTVGRVADASFITHSGCSDFVFGVTIRDGVIDIGSPGVEAVDIFWTDDESACELGISSSFAGSAPLLPGEFGQTGTDTATLVKDFNVAGHELHLNLAWMGSGEVTIDPATGKSSRPAVANGEFSVDGMEQISGNSLFLGGLSVTQTRVTTPDTCLDKHGHEKKLHKNGKPRHDCVSTRESE